jgi:hypothetical protein
MRRTTVFISLVVAGALVLGGCKKDKKPEPGKTDKAGATKVDKPKPKKPEAKVFDKKARKRIAEDAKYTKDPIHAEMVKAIKDVAEKCQKAKKYVSSLTWCEDWKAYKKKFDEVFKAMQGTEPKTVRKGMAIVSAAAKHLKDESLFVRMTALNTINWAAYRLSYAKADEGVKRDVRRMLGWVYKNDKTKEARRKAIDILGNDGGVIGFRGDAQDARVLFHAAAKDADKWVRSTALTELRGCVKAGSGKCPLQPDHLRKWYGAEADKSNKQKIAGLAGKLKMSKEVMDWCKGHIADGTIYWGCRDGLKDTIGKENFDAFLKLADAFIASEASKKKNEFRTKYLAEIMVGSLKNGAPKDKVMTWLTKVLGQPETLDKRSWSLATYIVRNMISEAKGKDEIKKVGELVKKHVKIFTKAWEKDKYKKSAIKSFEYALKALDRKKG